MIVARRGRVDSFEEWNRDVKSNLVFRLVSLGPPLFAILSFCGLDALVSMFSTGPRLFVTSARSAFLLLDHLAIVISTGPLLFCEGDDSSAFAVDLPA